MDKNYLNIMTINCPRIVLTGGPCGGKTTLMNELCAKDQGAKHWLVVPEAAPLLFQAGLDGRQKKFQRAVVHLQIAMEEICAEAARPGQVLLCHRGTLDPLAYWLRNGWEEDEFFDLTAMTRTEHLYRYDSVLHLQTAAIGAEKHYRRWPDAHRPETIEQAIEIDNMCLHVWNAHPHHVLIENAHRNWTEKKQVAHNLLIQWLSQT